MDNEAIVTSWIACWATEDVEMTLLHLHEHIIYKVHASSEVLPFGGEKRGRDDLRNLMFDVLANFDVLEYSLKFIRVVGNGARAHVRYIYRHRATGEVLEDTRRLVVQFQDGLIGRIDAFYDDRMVEAFMRMTQYRVATNQVERPPQLPRGRAREGSGAGA
jgi:ketosteroid isomerase-like protein